MNKKMFKLIWFGFPLTKIVYAFLAYSNRKEINNSFEVLSLLMMLLGLITCTVSIILSKKIYQKNFFENKVVKALAGNKADNTFTIYYLFSMLLGLAETAALFGFVQYLLTGNLIVGCILYVFCFIAWAFNYPSDRDEAEL